MQSKKPVDPLDTFEIDIPVTAEDREAQWRIRDLDRMTPAEYLDFLNTITRDMPPARETNSPDDEPFEL